MPNRPPSPCTWPGGCPNLTTSGRCPTHRTQAEQQRGTAAQRGYNARWRKYRAWFLANHPWCSSPGCPELATEVDHIDGLGPLGPRGFDPANCRGLCKPHHSSRTARDQPGGFQQR